MYDKYPYVEVSSRDGDCAVGWNQIGAEIRQRITSRFLTICVECYPGSFCEQIAGNLAEQISPGHVLLADSCYLPPERIKAKFEEVLTDDPVFGRLNSAAMMDFLDPAKISLARSEMSSNSLLLVVGAGASLIAGRCDLLIYADMARWEIQQRYRSGEAGNLGLDNLAEKSSAKYKRGYFLDWRVADKLKAELLPRIELLLDCNNQNCPKMISGADLRKGLSVTAGRPFRVVPFFDPGPWGGHWMEKVCDLPPGKPNHAWCFDCVPEENSLLLGFGTHRVEVSAQTLVIAQSSRLLGAGIVTHFGAEFPIRFDFLDTMQGGNLSLQVHPRKEYIQENFGMPYTQDESYYLLDAGEDSYVYLGLKAGIDPSLMIQQLEAAANSAMPVFNAEYFINKFPARKHDHFLIPAGTVHCSGRNSMVLEISATPYIFTFKLWDWARLDLDGNPRPLHLHHGAANICWERTTDWVRKELINRIEPLAQGTGWRQERTGLHALEFIETHRHWFTEPVLHDTQGNLNVLNLVEGDSAIVESPVGSFAPFEVHYAETFIVPACVGPYVVRPARPSPLKQLATLKAFVRPECLSCNGYLSA